MTNDASEMGELSLRELRYRHVEKPEPPADGRDVEVDADVTLRHRPIEIVDSLDASMDPAARPEHQPGKHQGELVSWGTRSRIERPPGCGSSRPVARRGHVSGAEPIVGKGRQS